jgi:hypothetical protein
MIAWKKDREGPCICMQRGTGDSMHACTAQANWMNEIEEGRKERAQAAS